MGQQSIQSNSSMQQQVYSLPMWTFKKDKQIWIQTQGITDQPKKCYEQIRVVTYNIWFSDKYQPMRFENLCQILNQSQAQIIGLQESNFIISLNSSLMFFFSF